MDGPPAVPDDRELTVVIRGTAYVGRLTRGELVFEAEDGEDLALEATFFVPRLDADQDWELPNFIGYSGCLERVVWALEPDTNTIHFGSSGEPPHR